MTAEDLTEFEAFALRLAQAARAITLPGAAALGAVDNKAGAGSFDPVTQADKGAELAMRRLIEATYPEHGIAGEEFPDVPARGRYCWSLDPIDGTRSFICGMPTWVTLIALLEESRPVLGVIDAPRLDELYVGHAGSSRLAGPHGSVPLATSGCRSLAEARLSTTDPFLFGGEDIAAFERVRRAVPTVRYGHDGYAYARVAAGTIDLVVESGLKPFDYNALIPVVRGAGGFVGDWTGGEDFAPGRIVAAATRELFDEAVAALAG